LSDDEKKKTEATKRESARLNELSLINFLDDEDDLSLCAAVSLKNSYELK